VRWLADNTIPGLNVSQTGNPNVGPIGGYRKDWIDAALPDGERAGILEGALTAGNYVELWRWTEFWNKDLDRLFTYPGRPNAFAFPTHDMTVHDDGRVTGDGLGEYLVTPRHDPILGLRAEVVREAPWGVALLRSEGPWRADWRLRGSDEFGGSVGREPVTLDVFGDGERTVAVRLVPAPEGPPRVPYEVSAGGRVRRGVLALTRPEGRRLRLRVPAGSPVRIRALEDRELEDGRRRGLIVTGVEVG
jgi:hypothetical protein